MSELPFSPFLIAPWLFTVAHAYANEYNMCVCKYVCMYVCMFPLILPKTLIIQVVGLCDTP